MVRGWIAGLLTGVLVAGLGLVVVSLALGPVELAEAPGVAEDAGAETDLIAPDLTPDRADPEPAAPVPAEPAPLAEELEPTPAPDNTAPPATTPEIASGETAADPAAIAAPEPAAPVEEAAEAPVEPAVPVDEAETPVPEMAEPDVAAEMPTETGDADGMETAAPTAELDTPDAAPIEPAVTDETDAAPEAMAQPEAVPAPIAPDVAAAPEIAAPSAAEPTPAPAEPAAAEPAPEIAATPAEEPAPAVDNEPAALPQIVVEADPEPTTPEFVVPKSIVVAPEADLPPEVDGDPGALVVTDRLPRIGDAPVEEAPAVAAPEPALSRNAIAFTGGDQPRLALLLIDTGAEDRASLGDLGNLPFPVTVAVDASAADAQQAVRFYRDKGAEVMLAVPLPEGATPTDIDVTMEAYAPLLDHAVAVLAEEDLGFQTLGAGAVQMATNLAEEGLGLVSFPAGLNTGHKAALKQGVAAALVFRDLDSQGQDGAVIRRFLDNAAFRARNEAGVIVVARTRADTLQALIEWSLGTRAQTVALAPVSAVLERN